MAAARLLLWGAILFPILYFAAQLVAALFYPGFDVVRDIASLLGTDASPLAVAFNSLMIASGVCAVFGAAGLAAALRHLPGALLALAVLLMGAGNIWAGLFPLPDQRHLDNPFLIAFVAAPFLAWAAARVTPALRRWTPWLLANLLLFALLAAMRYAIETSAIAGLLQRLMAASVMLPVALLAARFSYMRASR